MQIANKRFGAPGRARTCDLLIRSHLDIRYQKLSQTIKPFAYRCKYNYLTATNPISRYQKLSTDSREIVCGSVCEKILHYSQI